MAVKTFSNVLYCNLQKLQTIWPNFRNMLSSYLIALRATHIASAMLQPMYLTYNRLHTFFALKAILLSIPTDVTTGHVPHRSRHIWRTPILRWCYFIIRHSKEILLPRLTRKAIHVVITYYVSFSRCHTERRISRYYFNNIINLLN